MTSENNLVSAVNTENYDAEINSGQLTLVDFWAEWCGPCRTLGPIVEQLARDNEGHLKVLKVDVDENAELAQRYAIRGIPTLLLLKDGEELERIVGVEPKEKLQMAIDKYATAIA